MRGWCAWIAVVLTTALGLFVSLGWQVQSAWMVQLDPSYAPMQPNAALCFTLLGVAGALGCRSRLRAAAAVGGVAALIAALTLAQYATGIDLRIDLLVADAFVQVATSHPGRMSPNLAVGFVLAGLAFVLAPGSGRGPRVSRAIAAALVVSIGTASFLGYATDVVPAFGWGAFTRIAVHAAAGLVVLGAGLLALHVDHRATPWSVPLTVATGVAAALFSGALIDDFQERTAEAEFARSASIFAAVVHDRADDHVHALKALREHLERTDAELGAEFAELAAAQHAADAQLGPALWASHVAEAAPRQLRVERVSPPDALPSLLGADLLATDTTHAAAGHLLSGSVLVSSAIDGHAATAGGAPTLLMAPVRRSVATDPRAPIAGCVGVVFDVARHCREAHDALLSASTGVVVRVGGAERIVVAGDAAGLTENREGGMHGRVADVLSVESACRVGDATWTLVVLGPRSHALPIGTWTSLAVVLSGAGLTAAFALILAISAMRRRRAEEMASRVVRRTRELENANASLARSEHDLRSLFESSPTALLQVDRQGLVVLANERAGRLFACEPGQLVGLEFEHIVPGLFAALSAGSGTPPGGEATWEALTREGDCVPVQVATSSVGAHAERTTLLALEDVSSQLEREREVLRQRAKDLETQIRVISHDVKEPLRAIESFSGLVHERYRDQLDAFGADLLDRIVRAARRQRRLIDDVTALSRARAIESTHRTLDLGAAVSAALRQLTERIEETGAVVRVEGPFPGVRVDATWATQAVTNLVSNALKFVPEGAAPVVTIAAYSAPDGTQDGLVVCDRGPGVEDALSERIFELFQRGVPREVEGTGAGLAIVAEIARKHGGRAWVENRDGGGAAFFVTVGAGTREGAVA